MGTRTEVGYPFSLRYRYLLLIRALRFGGSGSVAIDANWQDGGIERNETDRTTTSFACVC